MRCQALVILLVAAGCDDLSSRSGPTVSVLRQTRGACFELMAGPRPPAGMGGEPCSAVTTNTKLIAGLDVVQLVIDYGAIDVPASAIIPPPMPSLQLDGVATTPAPNVQPEPPLDGHTYFLAYATAPTTLSNHVQITVPVVAGYGAAVPTIFQTVDAPITASLLVKAPAGCFTPVGAAPSAELGLANLCTPPPADPVAPITAGLDTIMLVVDYGVLDIPDSATIPPPSLTLSVDGVPQPGALTPDALHASASGRRYVTAVSHAPATASRDVRIAARPFASSPLATELRLTSVAPVPTASIIECGPPPAICEATAAVGSVHLAVALPGDVARAVTIHSLIDGVLLPDPPAVTTAPTGTHTEGVRAIDVPGGVTDGALWTLRAQLDAEPGVVVIRLHPPAITSALSCPSPCTIAAGATLGLTVAAYATRLAGVPNTSGTLDLLTIDNAAGTASGATPLVAPATPGPWTIDVSVADYAAQTLVVNVTP
jgi:hypothetical protein